MKTNTKTNTKVKATNNDKTSSLESFEKQVLSMIKTVDLKYFDLDKYIQDNGFSAKSALQAEETKELLDFEKQVLSMVKTVDLRYFNLDKYIQDNGFSTLQTETLQQVADKAKQLYQITKDSRKKDLAFTLSQKKEINKKALQGFSGTDLVNFFFFHALRHGEEKNLTLKKTLDFVNEFKTYNSQGHFQYLANKARKADLLK